ncbi:MAG TPA: hypothetical protein VL486_14315 [Verrucomicrobiae bacterium]|nr:hypothetical protein [Verrucomicrobiae bacterium]
MSETGLPMDAASKRWLVALAIVLVIAVVALTRSFINAFSPAAQNNVAGQPGATHGQGEVRTISQPEWIHPQEFRAVEEQHAATGPLMSDSREATTSKQNETVREEMVHKQAECLRTLVNQNKLPAAYGHLTLDRIDEMEKKGIVIE